MTFSQPQRTVVSADILFTLLRAVIVDPRFEPVLGRTAHSNIELAVPVREPDAKQFVFLASNVMLNEAKYLGKTADLRQ